ncbi:MAG: hypothetical protein HRT42_13825 [Campylobacteraceae bacterium]|nr:hypothetical protein [Campylobacteraceae bacterium]
MSNIGLYICYNDNNIREIIVNCNGTLRAFSKEEYIKNNIEPQIKELVDEKEYSQIKKSDVSPILLALLEWKKGQLLTDEITYKLQQFGFIFSDNKGILRITKNGEYSLKENGLV